MRVPYIAPSTNCSRKKLPRKRPPRLARKHCFSPLTPLKPRPASCLSSLLPVSSWPSLACSSRLLLSLPACSLSWLPSSSGPSASNPLWAKLSSPDLCPSSCIQSCPSNGINIDVGSDGARNLTVELDADLQDGADCGGDAEGQQIPATAAQGAHGGRVPGKMVIHHQELALQTGCAVRDVDPHRQRLSGEGHGRQVGRIDEYVGIIGAGDMMQGGLERMCAIGGKLGAIANGDNLILPDPTVGRTVLERDFDHSSGHVCWAGSVWERGRWARWRCG